MLSFLQFELLHKFVYVLHLLLIVYCDGVMHTFYLFVDMHELRFTVTEPGL